MTDSNIVAGLRTDAALFGKMPPHAKVNMNPEFMREMSQLWIAAADEIERLRAERDEARRDWCRLWAAGGPRRQLAPTQAARLRKWDCFKENSDG